MYSIKCTVYNMKCTVFSVPVIRTVLSSASSWTEDCNIANPKIKNKPYKMLKKYCMGLIKLTKIWILRKLVNPWTCSLNVQ